MRDRQRIFIQEYLKDFNATQAAIRAGYSERTAGSIGSENLTKPEIRAEIDRFISENRMSAEEVLSRLSDMARADIDQVSDGEGVNFSLDWNRARENGMTKLIKKVRQKRTIRRSGRRDDEVEEIVEEIELYDAQAALDKLARYHKLYSDTTIDANVTVDIGERTAELLKKVYGDGND